MSWPLIRPYLQPIEHLLLDPSVTEVMVNGSSRVFIEKYGQLQEVPGIVITEKALQVAVRNIARILGDDISEEKPLLDARLPDGSRVAAVFPPCSVTGTILTIRKFHSRLYSADELVRVGTLTPDVLRILGDAVERRQNILISGGTGSGKTTLLTALGRFISPSERVIVIEDTSEIQLEKENLVRLEARREQSDCPGVTIRDLVRATLRLRPDRILLGEVRGGEAFDLLQALNTGHSGTLSTIHADSAVKALSRFSTCVLMSGIELPYQAIRSNIGETLNLLVHIERRKGFREVTQVLRLSGYHPASDSFDLETLYERTL